MDFIYFRVPFLLFSIYLFSNYNYVAAVTLGENSKENLVDFQREIIPADADVTQRVKRDLYSLSEQNISPDNIFNQQNNPRFDRPLATNLMLDTMLKLENQQDQIISDVSKQQKVNMEMLETTLRNQTREIYQDFFKNQKNDYEKPDVPAETSNTTSSKIDGEGDLKNVTYTKTNQLLKYLKSISSSKTISGLYVTGKGNERTKGVKNILKTAGVLPGILNSYMPSYSDDEADWQEFTDGVISNWNSGYLVSISWIQVNNPLRSMPIFQSSQNLTTDETRWNDLIMEGGNLNKEWKKQLDKIEPFLKQLQTAGVVFICDLIPWINEKSTPLWSGRPGANGSAKFHQMTYDYLTKHHGLNSFLWTLSLYSENGMTQLQEYWPGNNYVDVVSVAMLQKNALAMHEYENLLKVARDTPIGMDILLSVPNYQLFMDQPRWVWFTVVDNRLENSFLNNNSAINATFNSRSVLNRANVEFFKIEN